LQDRSNRGVARLDRPQRLIPHQHEFACQRHQPVDQRDRNPHGGRSIRAARRLAAGRCGLRSGDWRFCETLLAGGIDRSRACFGRRRLGQTLLKT
jgi:hypothetical protein